MRIFIDESGQAVPSAKDSVACVTALVIPDSQVNDMNQWFLSIEKEYGKPIKGKAIDRCLRNRILMEVLRFDIFVECTAIDMQLHSDEMISENKARRASFIENTPPTQNPHLQKMRSSFANSIANTFNQLYLQAILNWDLVELILRHGTIYYSQHRPEELAAFHWIIDPKQAGQITPFEKMWTELVLPYLQCQLPLARVKGYDYSYFERFTISNTDIEISRTDSGKKLKKENIPLDHRKIMTEHLDFPDDKDTPGLRLVDVISNSIFQNLNGGSFQEYQHLGPLFFKRRPHKCINLKALNDLSKEIVENRPYCKSIFLMEKTNRSIWVSL